MGRYWLQTLGCPKNQVDSDKLEGYLAAQGYEPAATPGARRPRRGEHLRVHRGGPPGVDRRRARVWPDRRRPRGPPRRHRLHGRALRRRAARALPEVDLVAGFGRDLAVPTPRRSGAGVPVALDRRPATAGAHFRGFDLLELPRPAASAPWAYVKVAEGCDRICGFCAIPSFRGTQRSRPPTTCWPRSTRSAARAAGERHPSERSCWSPRTSPRTAATAPVPAAGRGRRRPLAHRRLTRAVAARVERDPAALPLSVRLDRRAHRGRPGHRGALLRPLAPARLAAAAGAHAALGRRRPLPAPDRRHPRGRAAAPPSGPRSSSATRARPRATTTCSSSSWRGQLDWAGFFPFSPEDGTHAADLPDQVAPELALERLRECAEIQDAITADRRDALVGRGPPGARRRPGRGAHRARGTRDRRRRARARSASRSASSSTWW